MYMYEAQEVRRFEVSRCPKSGRALFVSRHNSLGHSFHALTRLNYGYIQRCDARWTECCSRAVSREELAPGLYRTSCTQRAQYDTEPR
jgi:hypothetical protein